MRHPDEGLIHAWLDDALDPMMAAELEAHLAACPACADAVAEARGLVAGASRILLALDNVPSGVIPAAPHAIDGSPTPELGAYRARHDAATTTPHRRPVPWYARRPIQIAASLMLVAGIGGVVVRSADRPDEKVFIQFETDGAPAARGPAAGSAAAPITLPAPIAESANDIATTPRSAEPLRGTVTAPAQRRANPLAGIGATADRSLEKAAAAGSTRERVAEERPLSVVAAEPRAPAAVPPPSAPLPGAAAVAAPFASSVTANAPTRMMMDSLASPLGRNLTDMGAVRRSATTASGTVAGKVIAPDDSPIAMATVSIASANITVQTATDGSFTLPPLAPGRYTVEARSIGYSAARLEGLEIIAGDTAYARLAMKPSVNQLSEVVVTGAGAAARSLGGACFVLNVTPPSGDRGIPLLPRRVRFRLAALSTSSNAAAESAGARMQARAADASRAESSMGGEPAAPLPWEPKGENAIEVTWPIAGDVVTLTLEVRGSSVSGRATGESHPIRSAGVGGRMVDCATR